LGANFFCSRQFEETKRQINIIPTLVYQLSRLSRSFAEALLRANKFDSVDVFSKQMDDLFVAPWEKSRSKRSAELPPYLVIVDALDEIEGEEGSAFLRYLLETINDGHLRGLKFLITSRPNPELAKLCASFTSDTVCRLYDVPTETVEADIAKYLKAEPPALQDEPQISRLVENADGLFIATATMIRYLCPRPRMTKGEQLKLMSKLLLPTSGSTRGRSLVDEFYQQILWAAFRDLDDDLTHDHLNILHILLSTEERVSTSVAGRLLHDSNDSEDIANLVVDDLHAVLYIKDGRVVL